MWLLITYITIWTVAPGPVFIKIIQVVRNQGTKAGLIMSMGATLTAILMVIAGLIIYTFGLSTILDSVGVIMIEQIGAVAIILMGLYAGYKCFKTQSIESGASVAESAKRSSLIQGMGVMATGIPQALLVYVVMIPQTVELRAEASTIIGLGSLNVLMVFAFYSLVAIVTGRSQQMVRNNRFKNVFDYSLAGLLIGMGTTALF